MNDTNEQLVYVRTNPKDIIGIVQKRLEELKQQHSLNPLKQLFWTDLSYNRENTPLAYLDWPESIRQTLQEPPLLFATGGRDNDFNVIYIHMAHEELLLGHERPVVLKLLAEHLDALFILSNAGQSKWHFVNVKQDSKRSKRPLLRRITVGPEERLRTASERLALLDLASKEQASRLVIRDIHEQAFDVQAVTDTFFKDYKYQFQLLQRDLEIQTGDLTWAHDYALQFLNRCMFLHFIQRKGWLGHDREFLRSFWRNYKNPDPDHAHLSEYAKDAFFKYWLSVLFFEAFNRKFLPTRTYFPSDVYDILIKAPYLNGGLFSPNLLDRQDSFNISDNRFEEIFDFLQSYNFTIAEDSPLDQEVAVDPEMIGRVYENLVNVSTELDKRGDAGIFYTPRTEIDLMCRLALVDYLANNLPGLKKSYLYDVVFAFEPNEKTSADDALKVIHAWDRVHGLLREVTVVDPACGSGAFLVGMLHVLDDLQERANRQIRTKPEDEEDAYARKKRIIGKSLYGVDAMEWAAHIAELRLWLTLIIDAHISTEELHIRRDPLLPHLTFKVRFGDSLVQEVGGLNLGHMQATSGISPMLKRRLTSLKDEKVKFYHHDPSCIYRTREAAMQDEMRLFREIIQERLQSVEKELRSLAERPIQSSLPLQERSILSSILVAHEEAERTRKIEEKESEKQQVVYALNALNTAKQVPFVWDIAFVEVLYGGDNLGFDVVIGNPPYVRQEQIANPAIPHNQSTEESRRAYKRKLASMVYNDYPDFFQYKPGKGTVGHPINAQSDLYIYFYLHGLRLLNTRGSFCFITSNSWLDVAYGAELQEFLLKYCHIKMILDNQAKRSFAQAAVNTVIALFSSPAEKPSNAALDNIARFVLFKADFEQILSSDIFKEIEETVERTTTPLYRVYPITQKLLLADGIKLPGDESVAAPTPTRTGKASATRLLHEERASYSANKWGGKFLRAPDIYWTILEKGKGKLVRLGDIAEVRRGITTGANEFFYLDEEQARQWKIEAEFLQPVIKSPRECKSILIDPTTLKFRLFVCHKTKAELRGTAALKYIEWGESQNFHKRPSCRGRARWWDLGDRRYPQLGFNYLIDTTAKTFYAPKACLFSDNFQEVHVPEHAVLSMCATLNSTVFQLMVNVAGRSNFGDGLLKIQTYEVSDLLCVNPATIAFNNSELFAATSWETLHPSTYRRSLDTLIFDALNLTYGERDAMYEAVIGLVSNRVEKAESLKTSKEINRRLEAVESTLGIWMGIPEEEEEVDSTYA
jgi:hypothetical protein